MLKKSPKPKKQVPLSTITNRLDKLVSKIVCLRDSACVTCNSTENPQCGHFVGRIFINTRWDLTNCHRQCSGCNFMHENDSMPYTLFIARKYGPDYPAELSVKAHKTKVLTRSERLELEILLKQELAKLEASHGW